MTSSQKAGVRGAKLAARERKARKEATRIAVGLAARTGSPVDNAQVERVAAELLAQEAPATTALSMLRRSTDAISLQSIEMSIRRDLEDSRKLDKASAFVGVRIGLSLQAGKALVQHGMFETWVGRTFEGFSERQSQYYLKLGKVFLQESGGQLQLPQATEMGALMVRSSDGSELHKAVMAFVGDASLPELLDRHGIKAKSSAPGGFRPSAYMVAKYQGEHPDLAGKPFEQWPAEEQEAFRVWQQHEVATGDSNDATRVASEGKWASLRESLADHGIKRRTFAYLTKQQMEETLSVLALVSNEIKKALKKT